MARHYEPWPRYVPVAERRRKAATEMGKLAKQGHSVSPVVVEGRTIVKAFWGKAWCDNLERYSDYANRLPRGRTYVRNGSVVDLHISAGTIRATVSGSALYRVTITIAALPAPRWHAICQDCTGAIDSLVELLQGTFSKAVMARVCQAQTGLFPSPAEIQLACSCPDWATMCKHVAAVLYGVGVRLDTQPDLLFTLRQVDQGDLIAKAGAGLPLSTKAAKSKRVLEDAGLSDLFGLDLDSGDPAVESAPSPTAPAAAKPRAVARTKVAAAKTPVMPVKPKRRSDAELIAEMLVAMKAKAPIQPTASDAAVHVVGKKPAATKAPAERTPAAEVKVVDTQVSKAPAKSASKTRRKAERTSTE